MFRELKNLCIAWPPSPPADPEFWASGKPCRLTDAPKVSTPNDTNHPDGKPVVTMFDNGKPEVAPGAAYDARGNLATLDVTTLRGQPLGTATYHYDDSGHLIRVDLDVPRVSYAFEYVNGRLVRERALDGSPWTWDYTYDDAGYLIAEGYPVHGQSPKPVPLEALTLVDDGRGHGQRMTPIAPMSTPDDMMSGQAEVAQISYYYDSKHRLSTTVQVWGPYQRIDLVYDDHDRLKTVTSTIVNAPSLFDCSVWTYDYDCSK